MSEADSMKFEPNNDRVTPSDYINALLSARELSAPDGRPLIAYQFTHDDFIGLQRSLKAVPDRYPSLFKSPFALGPAFLLYGAEWWRREYQGGHWSWQQIISSLEWSPDDRGLYTDLVAVGAQIWGRKLQTSKLGIGYLSTIVLEGGIPLRLLDHREANYTKFLKALMGEYVKWHSAGLEAISHARGLDRLLPKTYRKEDIFRLSAEVVEVLFSLSEKLTSKERPYHELNERFPDWSSGFPMSLDAESAQVLVESLLKEAKYRKRFKYERLKISRVLRESQSGFEQGISIELPERVPTDFICEKTGLRTTDLAPRLELVIETNGSQTPIASLIKMSDDTNDYLISMYRKERLKLPLAFSDEVACSLQQQGKHLSYLAVEGGDPLALDLPLVFIEDDVSGYKFIGQGGVKTKAPNGIVMAPSCSVFSGDGSVIATEIEFDGALGTLYSAQGKCIVAVDTNTFCTVYFGAEIDNTSTFIALGTRVYAVEHSGQMVFAGIPNVVSPSRLAKLDQLIWRPALMRGDWCDTKEARPLGTVQFRGMTGGQCVFSTRLTILPDDFVFKFTAGNSNSAAEVQLSGLGAHVAAALDENSGLELLQLENDDSFIIRECEGDFSAGRFALALRWGGGLECDLMLPRPNLGARFISVVPRRFVGREIALSELLDVSVQAVSPTTENARYQLVAELNARDIPSDYSRGTMHFEIDIPAAADGYYELPLSQLYSPIKALFSISVDLDARVRLEVVSAGRLCAFIDVLQFGSEIAFEDGHASVIYLFENQGGLPALKFLPFNGGHEVEYLAPVLPSHEGASWEWHFSEGCAPCSGMVLVDGVRSFQTRPFVLSGPNEKLHAIGEEQLGEIRSLDEESEREMLLHDILELNYRDVRRSGLKAFFNVLLENPMHSGWGDLLAHLNRFKDIHPDAMDSNEVLIEHPEVLVGLILRGGIDMLQLLDQWHEYLPLRLWLVPVVTWERAVDSFFLSIEQYGSAIIDTSRRQFVDCLQRLELQEDIYGNVVGLLKEKLGIVDAAKSDQSFNLSKEIENARLYVSQNIFTRPETETWPNGIDREDWNKIRNNPLWLDPGQGYRSPFLDAPVFAAFAVCSGVYLRLKHRAFISSIRQFDTDSFDNLYSRFVAIYMSVLRPK